MNWHKKSCISSMIILALFFVPLLVVAATPTDPCNGGICNPLGTTTDLGALILKIVDGIVQVGYYVVVLFIIYSGFKFVTARGNDKKLIDARQTFLYTVIGAGILLGATLLANVIGGTVDQLKASAPARPIASLSLPIVHI